MGVFPRAADIQTVNMQTCIQLTDRQTSGEKDLQICRQLEVEKQIIRQQKSRDTGSREADKRTAERGQADKEKQICFPPVCRLHVYSSRNQPCRPHTAGSQTCRQLHTAESKQANAQSWTSPQTAVYSRKTSICM